MGKRDAEKSRGFGQTPVYRPEHDFGKPGRSKQMDIVPADSLPVKAVRFHKREALVRRGGFHSGKPLQ
jgi:hypothetical protein